MAFIDNVLVFLGTVAIVTTTGALMPGPVTAVVMAKGLKDKWAGLHIALGHGVVEFPTIAVIALGFYSFLTNPWVTITIGLLGGALLIIMGLSMLLSRKGAISSIREAKKKSKSGGTGAEAAPKCGKDDPFPYHPLVVGVLTTASNPYYFIWWATLGAVLVLNALELGLAILIVMSILHFSFDLGWLSFLGFAANKSNKFWDRRAYVAVLMLCAVIMLAFGAWFMGSAALSAAHL